MVRTELTTAQLLYSETTERELSYKDDSIECQVAGIGKLLSDSAVAQELVLDSDGLHSVVQVLNGLACLFVFRKVDGDAESGSLVIIHSVCCCVTISSFVQCSKPSSVPKRITMRKARGEIDR